MQPGRLAAVVAIALGALLALTASANVAADQAIGEAPRPAGEHVGLGGLQGIDAEGLDSSDASTRGWIDAEGLDVSDVSARGWIDAEGLDSSDASTRGWTEFEGLHQAGAQSPCLTALDARPRPSAVLVGEAVSTTLQLELLCPDFQRRPVHIVLLVDSSGSMAGTPSSEVKAGLGRFVRELRLPENPHIKIGVVEFNTRARTLCFLTNQAGRVIGCTKRVGAAGGTELHLGLEEASRVFRTGREGVQPSPLELLLIISDISVDQRCAFARARANTLKSEGVRIVTACLGPNCHTACLRDVASSATDAHISTDFNIDTVVDGLVTDIVDAFAWSIEIELDVDPRVQWIGVSPNLTNLPNEPLYDPVVHRAWLNWQFPSQSDFAAIRLRAVAPGTFVPFTVRRAEVVSPSRTVPIPVSVRYLMALAPGP